MLFFVKASLGERLDLTYEVAKDLAGLPLECYNKYYPFKFSQVWKNASDVAEHTVRCKMNFKTPHDSGPLLVQISVITVVEFLSGAGEIQ